MGISGWTHRRRARCTAWLIEWAVEQIGHDRILFGTDTPLYWAGAQKGRIESAQVDDDAKQAILWDNAARLLDLALPDPAL
ncbi:MAG: amidohydrolase family protein [Thermomicrobiales bacterium]